MQQSLTLTPREELLWLAALLDGEGCFTFNIQKNGAKYPNIILKMTDEDIVRTAWERAGVGHVTGPYPVAKAHHKPAWIWRISEASHVFTLCRLLFPYMGTRRAAKIEEILALEEKRNQEPLWVRVAEWER